MSTALTRHSTRIPDLSPAGSCRHRLTRGPAPRQALGASVLAWALLAAGCGGGEEGPGTGGSGSGSSSGGGTSAASSLQGLWEGTLAVPGTLTASAIALPDGQLWLVAADPAVGVRMVKASLSAQGSGLGGTGKSYTLGAAVAANAASAAATVQAKSKLSGTVSVGAANQTFSLVYNSRYETAAKLEDFVGDWAGAATNQMVTMAWRISDKGEISGNSTTGLHLQRQPQGPQRSQGRARRQRERKLRRQQQRLQRRGHAQRRQETPEHRHHHRRRRQRRAAVVQR